MEEYECRVGPAIIVNGSGPREHVQEEVPDVAWPEHEVEGLGSLQDHRVV